MYGKEDIVDFVKADKELKNIFPDTLNVRLQEIINFLNEDRVKEVLELEIPNSSLDQFYKEEMSITKRVRRKVDGGNKGRKYNLLDAIFLGVLLIFYENSYFESLRKGKTTCNRYDDERNWITSSTDKIRRFETLWKEEGDGRSWDVISTNIIELFKRLTLIYPELEKKYTKTQVIEEAFSRKKLSATREDYEKRFQVIIKFLNEERVQYILEQQRKGKDLGSYFYNKEMNITNAETRKKGGKYSGYDYNLIDLIFLGVLVIVYDDPYFKRIRKGSTKDNPEEEGRLLFESFLQTLNAYMSLWEQEGDGRSWSVINLNLQSLFYRLTMIDTTKTAVRYRKYLDELAKIYEELPEHYQIEFFEGTIKVKINFIEKKLDEYIETMKDEHDEYLEYLTHKRLVEIDRSIEKGNDASCISEDLISRVLKKYEELPDYHQIVFYERVMKNRINTIGRKLDEYIDTIKEGEPQEYLDYLKHKEFVEEERAIESNHSENRTMKDLMDELRSKYYKE